MQSQKEVLADGSKSLSSSLIAGHSREAIVDINTRATRLLSSGRITTLQASRRNIVVVKLPTSDDRHHLQVFVTEHDRTTSLSRDCVKVTVHHTVKPKPHR